MEQRKLKHPEHFLHDSWFTTWTCRRCDNAKPQRLSKAIIHEATRKHDSSVFWFVSRQKKARIPTAREERPATAQTGVTCDENLASRLDAILASALSPSPTSHQVPDNRRPSSSTTPPYPPSPRGYPSRSQRPSNPSPWPGHPLVEPETLNVDPPPSPSTLSNELQLVKDLDMACEAYAARQAMIEDHEGSNTHGDRRSYTNPGGLRQERSQHSSQSALRGNRFVSIQITCVINHLNPP